MTPYQRIMRPDLETPNKGEGPMSMSEWTNGDVRRYENAINASHKQKRTMATRTRKWLDHFIDGTPVQQFDKFVRAGTKQEDE